MAGSRRVVIGGVRAGRRAAGPARCGGPASMNCQPASRTIDSAARPDRASIAAITRPSAPCASAATGRLRSSAREVALEVADDEPRVVGELVADLGGGVEQAAHRVGHRARPVGVDEQGPQLGAGHGECAPRRSSPTKPG